MSPHSGSGARYGKLGPDLAGVTKRRPAAWLHRWIRKPDPVRAQKSPAAMALMAKYRNLPMPNLKLGNADTAEVIKFIAAETKRQKRA